MAKWESTQDSGNVVSRDGKNSSTSAGGYIPAAGFRYREVGLADVIGFVLRHWKLLVIMSTLPAILTFFVLYFLSSAHYEASTTIALIPPRIYTIVKMPEIGLLGYQKILESDSVIFETQQKLVAKGRLQEGKLLRLNQDIFSKIYFTSSDGQRQIAPLLVASVKAKSPEQATAICKTWTEVFLARANELVADSTLKTIDYVDREYPKAISRLEDLEKEKLDLMDRYITRQIELSNEWHLRIMNHRAETIDMLGSYDVETQILRKKFNQENNLDTLGAEVESLRTSLTEAQKEHSDVLNMVNEKRQGLLTAEQELKATDEYLILRKAVVDDALWEAFLSSSKEEQYRIFENSGLVTQEINPLFNELLSTVAGLKIELRALEARADSLKESLQQTREKLRDLEKDLAEKKAGLEIMNLDRTAGREKINDLRQDLEQRYIFERDVKMKQLMEEREFLLKQKERAIVQQQKIFEELAEGNKDVALAKSYPNYSEIRIAGTAISRLETDISQIILHSILIFVIGLVLSIVCGLVIDVRDNEIQTSP